MSKRFIIIENIENPIIFELDENGNPDNYVVIRKSGLKELPARIRNKLFNQGLYQNKISATNNHNNLFPLHRLVLCIYDNALGFEVHHINKFVTDNNINNLIRISKEKHAELHLLPDEEANIVVNKMRKKFKDKLHKSSRNTLAQRKGTILDILKSKSNMSTKEIIKKNSKKLKKSTIYKIVNYYHYDKEFIKWFETNENKSDSALDGKFKKRWRHILDFEQNI